MNEKRRIIMKTKRNILGALVAGTLLAASGVASATTVWQWDGTAADWANPITIARTAAAVGAGGNGGVVYDGAQYDNHATFSPVPPPGAAPNGGNAGTTAAAIITAAPDVTFTYLGAASGANTIASDASTIVTLKEDHVNGGVFYNVHLSWGGSSVTSGAFSYLMDTTEALGFNVASLDSIVVGGLGTVTKQIWDNTGGVKGALLLTLTSVNGARVPTAGWDSLLPSTLTGYKSLYITDTITANSNVTDIFNEVARIPEPATLALLGIGMLGVFGLRRKSAVENSSSMTYC